MWNCWYLCSNCSCCHLDSWGMVTEGSGWPPSTRKLYVCPTLRPGTTRPSWLWRVVTVCHVPVSWSQHSTKPLATVTSTLWWSTTCTTRKSLSFSAAFWIHCLSQRWSEKGGMHLTGYWLGCRTSTGNITSMQQKLFIPCIQQLKCLHFTESWVVKIIILRKIFVPLVKKH